MKAATAFVRTLIEQGHISIHAAREGGDLMSIGTTTMMTISIHAAREGGDPSVALNASCPCQFQSTPPVKAATKHSRDPVAPGEFQSTPPVKAATVRFAHLRNFEMISIHAAREGGDGRRGSRN